MTVFGPLDDHHPAPGGRMCDSPSWEMIIPEERLGLQVYLYPTHRGQVGYNVAVWGPDPEPFVLDLGGGTVGDETDHDDFRFEGLHVAQPELRRAAHVAYASDAVRLEYGFTAVHEACRTSSAARPTTTT